MTSLRYLSARLLSTAEFRIALYEEREHLIIPVIALVGDEVIWASNAQLGPEFVPAEVLARSAVEWGGRPLVPDHPLDAEGKALSANIPEVCEKWAFGYTRNPRYEDGKLKLEAWIDIAKASKIGGDAQAVVERVKSGKIVECSIGAWVEVERMNGIHNGKIYKGVWTDIGSDHLALLPEGVEGACNVEMGCGGPRIAKDAANGSSNNNGNNDNGNEVTKMEDEELDKKDSKSKSVSGPPNVSGLPNFLQRLLSSLGVGPSFRSAVEDEGIADSELRARLWSALHAVEPAFGGIEDVFQESGTVIYVVYPENKYLWFRRTYSVTTNGEVTLNEDREQVEPTREYKSVVGASKDTAGDSDKEQPCSCHLQTATSNETLNESEKGDSTMNDKDKKKPIIARLLSLSGSPFKDSDKPYLESQSLARLQEMEEGMKAADGAEAGTGNDGEDASKAKPADGATSSTPSGTPTVKKPEEQPKPAEGGENTGEATVTISAAEHAALRRLASRQLEQDKARKNELVRVLKTRQSFYSEQQLNNMELPQLEGLAAVGGIETQDDSRSLGSSRTVDYSGRGLTSIDNLDDEDDAHTPPSIYSARLKNKAAAAN